VSDSLCTATQTQNPSVFRFKIPCGSTVIHTRPCHLHHRSSQRCHKYGGFGTPPGPFTNCMVFASPECVEKTCWWHCFPVTFCYFSHSIDSKKILYTHTLTNTVLPQKCKSHYKSSDWHTKVLNIYRLSQNSSRANVRFIVANYHSISQKIEIKNKNHFAEQRLSTSVTRVCAQCATSL
jgi:hypothetical protein